MVEQIAPHAEPDAPVLFARLLGVDDQEQILAFLTKTPERNLPLIDAVLNLAPRYDSWDLPPTIYGVFSDEDLCGVASFRPSLIFSAGMSAAAVGQLLPLVERIPNGLLKCESNLVDQVWPVLAARGRRTLIDRIEVGYRLYPEELAPVSRDRPGFARPGRDEDLDDLVYAARASLWEEDRPDPAERDPSGFARWVAGRLARARVVTEAGQLVFVSYADVRRDEGWLIQGVYTWPRVRRRGFAQRGMDAVIREAFASGAAHVQLAVVEGNERATALYKHLGFVPFQRLRTVLFR